MSKIETVNQRVFKLIDYLKQRDNLKDTAVWELLGIARQNSSKYKKGSVQFTVEQIASICKLTKGDANYVLGLGKQMFTESKTVPPLDKILQAVKELKNK